MVSTHKIVKMYKMSKDGYVKLLCDNLMKTSKKAASTKKKTDKETTGLLKKLSLEQHIDQ